jgi:hypothetical protein
MKNISMSTSWASKESAYFHHKNANNMPMGSQELIKPFTAVGTGVFRRLIENIRLIFNIQRKDQRVPVIMEVATTS